jgi:hypothetical protein
VIAELNNASWQQESDSPPAAPHDSPEELDEALGLTPAPQSPHPGATPVHQPVTNPQYLATEKQVKLLRFLGNTEGHLTDEQVDGKCMETFGALPAQLSKREISSLISVFKGESDAK